MRQVEIEVRFKFGYKGLAFIRGRQMIDFDKYLMKYGEYGVQDIIERLERAEGVKSKLGTTLEDRWNFLMAIDYSQQRMVA